MTTYLWHYWGNSFTIIRDNLHIVDIYSTYLPLFVNVVCKRPPISQAYEKGSVSRNSNNNLPYIVHLSICNLYDSSRLCTNHLLLYHDLLYFFAGDTDCSQDECHEGASDVISRSSLLRIVLFFLIIFLVSGCTIVVMVSGMIKNILSQITSTTSCYWTKSLTPWTFNVFETKAVRLFLLFEIISFLYRFITGLFCCFLFVCTLIRKSMYWKSLAV